MDRRSLTFLFTLTITLFCVHHFFFPNVIPNVQQQEAASTNELIKSLPETPSITYAAIPQKANEEAYYYVLENDYQQLVFSTKGGALCEINLLLQSKENSKSIVKSIGFDTDILENYPENANFPNYPYFGIDETGKVIKKEPAVGGYTPLIRRDLKNNDGKTVFTVPSRHYALNLIQDGNPDKEIYFQMKRMTKNSIEFESVSSDRRITKIFSFPSQDAPYAIDVTIKVEGESSNLWLTSGICEVELISGNYSPLLQYYFIQGQKTKVEKINLPKDTVTYGSASPLWVSNSNGFFGMILDPLSEKAGGFQATQVLGTAIPTRLTIIDAKYDLYPAKNYPGYQLLVPYKRTTEKMSFRLYAGPYEDSLLKQVDTAFTSPMSGGNPHYASAITYHGWFSFISEPFAKFLFILINFFYQITHSWGIAIILLTLALRIMLYPLNAWSMKSMYRMQVINPKVSAIQNKYKKDPKRAQLEIMQLYKEEKVNPFSGCLPLLIQMPFLIGMFDLLKSAFPLRGASFIPGWITNLSAPDVLFSWHYPIIFFGSDFHLLPFLLGASMFLQQKFNQINQGSKGPLTEQQRQQQSMGNIMTIVFTVMFYHFPSGLNIYWLFSTIFGILQQWYMTYRLKNRDLIVK
jgi:YidC/Oxa1 family membrane protein insertase